MITRIVAVTVLWIGCISDDPVATTDSGSVIMTDILHIDQGCIIGASECNGEGGLKRCVSGKWEINACKDLCAKEGAQVVGCGPNENGDICICLPYASFWEVCGARECGPGLMCRMITMAQGVCTRQCCEMKGMPCGFPPCPAGFWCAMGICEHD